MSGRISAATERALALVAAGRQIAAAARECGIAESTLHRAINRARPLTPPEELDRLEAELRAAGIPYRREGRRIIAG
ncbi:MAG: hypothetical protein NUV51_03670 [Sulfuricaulis sp.]|nr:hypothetical protein [Sulfuricaulis sp.]